MIASAIATSVINNIVNAVNEYGNDSGVTAYKGVHFINMTWVATILVLLSGFAWIFEVIKGRSTDYRPRVSFYV